MKKPTHADAEELTEAFHAASKDKDTLKAFLSAMLTPAELKAVITRWQIVKQLSAGNPQRAIAERLEVGIATVTRGSREMSKPNSVLSRIIRQMAK